MQVKKPWKADKVVFFNDVWLCASDIIRLLSHRDVNLACGMDFQPISQLYDVWVVRDLLGAIAQKHAPFLRHNQTREVLAAGFAVPVACCWNGLVAMDASPLLNGLQMRCTILVVT